MINSIRAAVYAPLAALLLSAPPCQAVRQLQQLQSPQLQTQPQAVAQPQSPQPQSPQVYQPPFWGGSSGPVSTGLIAYVVGAHGRPLCLSL